MRFPRLFRYRLSTLLVATGIVCVLLGYSQWRRTSMLPQIEEFKAQGVSLVLPDNLASRIWPAVPQEGMFEFRELPSGRIGVAANSYTLDEFNVYYESVFRRLHSFGVEEVRLVKNGKLTNDYLSTRVGKAQTAGE